MATFTKQGKIKVTVRIDKEIYRQIKIRAILADKTISEYYSDLIKKDLKFAKSKASIN